MNHILLGFMTGQFLVNTALLFAFGHFALGAANAVCAVASIWIAYSAIHRPQDWA